MNAANQTTKMKQVTDEIVTDEVEIVNSADTELERLSEELTAERDARLRLAAEYENYRKRTRRESEKTADEGKRELLEQMISLADDLDRALTNEDESPDAVAEGLRLIHRRFSAMLETNGVVPFESQGEKFDPERHEAFDVRTGTECAPGTVHTDIRRGYDWNGNLLRPALVTVTQ